MPRPGLFEAECDPTLGEVVWGHLDINTVAGQNADAVLAHFAAGMGQNNVLIIKFDAKHRVGQQLSDHATEFDHIFLRQTKTS